MNKKQRFFAVLLNGLALLLLSSCGDETVNDGVGNIDPIPTPVIGFVKTIEPGTVDGSSSYPFNTLTRSRMQQLYHAEDIDGSGIITHIGFRLAQDLSTGVSCSDVAVRLGQTNDNILTSTFSDNINTGRGSLTTAIDSRTITIPEGKAGSYFNIALDTPFNYNGIDNLVVDILRLGACTENVFIEFSSKSSRALVSDLMMGFQGVLSQVRFTKLTFSGGDNTQIYSFKDIVEPDTYFPISPEAKTQLLYPSEDLKGSGVINGIGFQLNTASNNYGYVVTVKMGHSKLASLGATYADNYSEAPVTMAENITFTIPAAMNPGDWFWLPLPDASFNYNGIDNLVVELSFTAGDGVTQIRHGVRENGRLVGNINPAATSANVVNDWAFNTKLRYKGGTIDHIVRDTQGHDNANWFTTSATGSIDQYLYLATELGSPGKITKIACRLLSPSPSVATDYTNFEVVMSHSSFDTLGTNVAANMSQPVSVFNGTFTVPANLLVGDWVEVPLSTFFDYDGRRNLVVQVKSDAGNSAHTCAAFADTVVYANRRLRSFDRTSATGSNFDHTKDIKLWME